MCIRDRDRATPDVEIDITGPKLETGLSDVCEEACEIINAAISYSQREACTTIIWREDLQWKITVGQHTGRDEWIHCFMLAFERLSSV